MITIRGGLSKENYMDFNRLFFEGLLVFIMNKKLIEELSIEELGKLFPIILVDHQDNWKSLYQKEKDYITETIGEDNIISVNHIGSTAVPVIKSKPTIDILLEIKNETDLDNLISNMKNKGYNFIAQPKNPEPHMMFTKGYTINGFKGQAIHIHVRYEGDWDEIYFCDYLKINPDLAAEYESLKIELSQKFKNNRELYTEGKSEFIKNATMTARNKLR